ncbi:MAG: DUF1013 domain-containing protein [Parvibaculum sp.]|uniref:DUF1013 domain-containing protein n=1 Tax=Parvibaculum sp. TaxID=2024848 RepID=UPI0025F7167F|nr:cell cycle transcriptional regulator TrcR [Parvibaculum sp.]MCE9648783.1 DUF1013 domain-containing protein [Parvibaculum sp.]
MIQPLMPKATAVWLVENTSLTFDQIADFCGLHVLEVKGIADGDVAQGIKGMDPIVSGQLSRAEIERCQGNPATRLMTAESKYKVPPVQPRKGPRYTPVSRRQDRPDAIAWLLRNHPELTDAQVAKLVGTTKPTIQSVRDRSHWNSANIKPVDPVTLGLSTQIELDDAVQKASRKAERERKKADKLAGRSETLLPASETTAPEAPQHATIAAPEVAAEKDESRKSYDADSVFAKLKDVKIEDDEED